MNFSLLSSLIYNSFNPFTPAYDVPTLKGYNSETEPMKVDEILSWLGVF